MIAEVVKVRATNSVQKVPVRRTLRHKNDIKLTVTILTHSQLRCH